MMANSGDDESDNLIEQVDLAWNEIDWDDYDMNPELAPEKVSRIKKLLRCIGWPSKHLKSPNKKEGEDEIK